MIRAIVTDIEGTTSSLSFVKDVLFPYARAHIEAYIREHLTDDAIESLLDDVRQEVGRELSVDEIIAQLIAWIDQDKKVTPLKAIQGLLWEAGYKQGDFQGHVYPDVVPQLKAWQQRGIKLYVYSSGSVFAQQLLFGHTAFGDLNPLFSGYFDTRIGAKVEPAAYQAIIAELGLPATDILFLSDLEKELQAAQQAGMQTLQLCREGAPPAGGQFKQVTDFTQIDPAAL